MIADISAAKFRFDKERHEYLLGDQKLPYWSLISKPYSGLENIPKPVLEIKRCWGVSVHEYLEEFDRGNLDLSAVMPAPEGEPDILKVVEGWERVVIENAYVFSAIELPILSKKYRYAGTLDRVSGNTVIDLKSSKPRWTTGVQLACYGQLAIEEELVDPAKLELVSWHTTEQGVWTRRTWDFKSNFNLFMCMLTLHNASLGG